MAYGYIYDESILKAGISYKMATYIIERILWGKILHHPFSQELKNIMLETPLDILARHKRLALYFGGLRHLLKPVSEAGIDTTNLPYSYVSIPNLRTKDIIYEIRNMVSASLGYEVSILVIDTDKSYKVKGISLAFSTRPSCIKNIIDLGGLAYLAGKYFRNMFIEYPTPVAYAGMDLPLEIILKVSRRAEAARGYGAGRNITEMFRTLNIPPGGVVSWRDLDRVKHYPIVIARLRF